MIKENLNDRLELTVGGKNKKLDEGHTENLTSTWKSDDRQPEGSSVIYHTSDFKQHSNFLKGSINMEFIWWGTHH